MLNFALSSRKPSWLLGTARLKTQWTGSGSTGTQLIDTRTQPIKCIKK